MSVLSFTFFANAAPKVKSEASLQAIGRYSCHSLLRTVETNGDEARLRQRWLVGEKAFGDLGIAMVRSPMIRPGTFQSKIYDGRVFRLEYAPAAESTVRLQRELQLAYDFLRNLEKLRRRGVSYVVREFRSGLTRIDVTSIEPSACDPFITWWANRRRRHGLSYSFDSERTGTKASGTWADNQVFLSPIGLKDSDIFEEAVIHETVHGFHHRCNLIVDYGKLIQFKSEVPMPGAPEEYGLYMMSGEFEAQFIGGTRGRMEARDDVWEHVVAFSNQIHWLKRLRETFPNAPIENLTHEVIFDGVPIDVTFFGPYGPDTRSVDRVVRETLDERIRELENIRRIRSESAARRARQTAADQVTERRTIPAS